MREPLDLEKLADIGQDLRDALEGGKAMIGDYAGRAGKAIRDGAHSLESAYTQAMRGVAPSMTPSNWSIGRALSGPAGDLKNHLHNLESRYSRGMKFAPDKVRDLQQRMGGPRVTGVVQDGMRSLLGRLLGRKDSA